MAVVFFCLFGVILVSTSSTKKCLTAQVPRRGANPEKIPAIEKRKSDMNRVFAFLLLVQNNLRRDRHEGARKDLRHDCREAAKTSSMTAAKKRQ